jgi:shikimate kinase
MTANEKSNLVLIGMPGAGKSTIGVILAKQASMDFVDTDVLIQVSQQRSLQDIIDHEGHVSLRQIEEDVLLGMRVRNHVIATGGSAAYSDPAMQHLKSDGIVVFLDVDLVTLYVRVKDFSERGLAKQPGQTFDDLYVERYSLYNQYADIIVRCVGLTQEEICAIIMKELDD